MVVVNVDNDSGSNQLEFDYGDHDSGPYHYNHQDYINLDDDVSSCRADLLGLGLGLGTVRRNRVDWLDLLYVTHFSFFVVLTDPRRQCRWYRLRLHV